MVEITIKAQAEVPASAPAGTSIPVSFVVDPQRGAEVVYQVPQGKALIVKDIYVTGAQSPDGIVKLRRNDFDEVLRTDPVSSLIVTNPAKPKYAEIVFGSGDRLSADYVTLEQNTATDAAGNPAPATITFYIKAELVDYVEEIPAVAQSPQAETVTARIKRALGLF